MFTGLVEDTGEVVATAPRGDGIELSSFEHHVPTLHDVFLELVGEEAKEASYR